MIRETLMLYEHSATFHPSSVNMQSEEAIISPLSGVQMRRVRRENRREERGTPHTWYTPCEVHASTHVHAPHAGTK